jgi:hypothetical protein
VTVPRIPRTPLSASIIPRWRAPCPVYQPKWSRITQPFFPVQIPGREEELVVPELTEHIFGRVECLGRESEDLVFRRQPQRRGRVVVETPPGPLPAEEVLHGLTEIPVEADHANEQGLDQRSPGHVGEA